jgi:hypothetical protein
MVGANSRLAAVCTEAGAALLSYRFTARGISAALERALKQS